MIRYAKYSVEIHGLNVKTYAELNKFRDTLKEFILSCESKPNGRYEQDSDVIVELEESAGKEEF